MTLQLQMARKSEELYFERDQNLIGHPIRLSDAADKYNMHISTLYRWAQSNYIRVLRRGPKLTELDEADVKITSEIFQAALDRGYDPVAAGWELRNAMEKMRKGG